MSDPVISFLLFLSGLLISALSTILGVGGGVFSVPLLHFFGQSIIPERELLHMAVSGSLVVAWILSLSGTIANWRSRTIDFHLALPLGSGTVLGALIGSFISGSFSKFAIGLLFSVLLLSTAIHTLIKLRTPDRARSDQNQPSTLKPPVYLLPLAGILIGILSSLTGVGGGVLMVPLLNKGYSVEMKRAVSTSTFCIIFTAFVGVLGYALFYTASNPLPQPSFGYLYLPFVIWMSGGAILGGYIGALTGKKIHSTLLKVLLSVLQIIVAFLTIYKIT